MAGKWQRFWTSQAINIGTCLQQWRQTRSAVMPLPKLSAVSIRKDLYDKLTVDYNNPSGKVSGKQHLLDLERVVAPMLNHTVSVTLSIVQRGGKDYLDFS